MNFWDSLQEFLRSTGIAKMFESGWEDAVKTLVMIAIAGILIYLAIGRGFEPLLLFRLRSACC